MNKTRYKVIFNKKRGCMVAVAEHTLREGKSAQDGSGACITPSENAPASAVCSGKIGLLSFSLMMCLGLALIVPAHASEIRPDRSAPGNQQPTILQTANGLPQVNIQTPSAAGVSLNQYRQFDVDTKGAVLNNSRSGVQTQLGGRIQGNPWLATGEARIIVNQINSTNPSLLNGYIEVGGRRAEVIMANPAGIRVNGAGFINAAGVTLTTGRPVLDNGALTGYQVREGEIAVNGGGLDTSTADYTRILSRAAQINAGIWGKDIQVAAGNNNVSANGKVHAVSNGQTPPAVAIDTGTLGGMYAGKITLISSDRGAAVRNAGQIFAAAGGVTLSADGTVGNSGSMVASDSAQSGADIAAVSVKATDLSNSGTLSSQGKAAIATHNLDNSGFIGSSDELAVVNQSALSNGGQINAARLDIQTGSLNNSGRIAQTGPQALALSAGSLDNRGSGYIGAPKADTTTGSPPVSATDKTAAAPTTAAGSGSVAAPSATAAHSPTLADGNITVTDSLANSGEITANNGTDLSTRNGLGNHAELSLNTLTVSGALFDNQSGSISAKQANITATAFDNRSGSLVASESIRIRNQSVDNRNGSLQSGGVLMVDTVSFDNSDGQTAALDTDITAKHLNNQKGSLDSGRLNIHAARLDNQSGFIRSDNETALQISDGLNNNGGEITSAQNVHITDSGQNTLSIQNSSGSILAGQDAAIQAKALEADGTLAAGRDLGISLQDDFTTAHNIEAGRALSISTQGRLQNAHLLQGGAAVTLNTADIDNTADGKIQSGSDTRLSASNITNRGLINSNGLTRIEGKDTVENIGSGKIYGDHVAFAAGKLLNREETAGGETRAAVIAARERLDIGAQDITNQESALLSSEGRLKIGGSLDAGHQTKGRAQTLINSSARIEAQGDGAIAVDDLQNVNKHFVAEEYLAESKQVMTFTRPDEAEPFFTNLVDGTFRWEKHDMNFDFYDGTNIAYKEGNVLGVKLEEYTESVYKQRVTENQPGEISIGGNLNVDADKITNRDSMILSGGAMATSSPIENEATPAPVKLARKGNLYTLFHQNSIKRSDPTAINTVITKQGVFEPATATVEEYSQAVLPVTNKQIEIQPVADLNIESVQNAIRHLPLPATLPISALYAVNPAHPQFLIETDPAFTDYRQWLGSDYMLKAFKQDPANMHKRLGDGYYEQKLVNEQIARLTGHRRLDGYQNDEDQFKALMDNGITYARTFNLTPGIALTAEQVARLTSDIVWLEPQSYTLIDGSRVTVLAPKVYVVARKGDVNSAGGLISADQIRLQSDGNLSNSGTIAGRSIVDLGAGNISNSGLIQGGQVRVQADERLEVIGGSIAADNALIARAKDIRIESTTATSGDKQNGSTVIDRVAGLYVNHISDGLMLVEAGKIDFVGATVRNEAAKGQTQIRAAGDLNLSTVQTENHESYGALSDKNHRHVHTSAETGTQIQTAGDIVLSGNNINARQADINSDSGDVVLDAKNNLNITEGRKTLDLDASAYSKQKKLTSSSSQLAQYRRNDDEAVSGSITGKRVFLNSGGDTLIRGSDIVSDNLTQITAGGNIAIEAAQSRYDGSEFHQSKKSGLMGSGGIGFTVGSKKDGTATRSQTTAHSGSTVGSLSGDTLIQAGGDYRQTGSTVSSPKGNVLIHARNIDIEAAQDTYATDYKHTIEQKGLTVAVNVPVVQAVQGAVAAAKTVGKSKNARVNAMAAANAAQSVRAADQALGQAAQNPQAAAQEVSVSITYGQQKSTDQSHITGTSALASQTIGGGKVSLIADNEAGNARIRIAGSDVAGKSGTLLSADSIALQSAEQTHSERSSNQSSGWNAGVAVSYGQNGFAFGITAGGNYGKGYGNGDDLTHRHSHIGDANSQTLIQSSGDTLIKGAQVKGQSIGLTAANLTIESVQDTAAYQSKQQNISGQVTVGYGVSGSASYSQSKTNADHASVTEQSGLFAGDGGFNVNIRNHTELKGGIITATEKAEAAGNNQFQTASLSSSDIQNHSRYEGESFGVGASGAAYGGWDGKTVDKDGKATHSAARTMGYGSDGDSQNSTTYSGIGTRNIHITDDSSGTQADTVYTDTRTEAAEAQSGRLKNVFDKERVQNELDLQREVSQQFSRNVQEVNREINRHIDDLLKQKEAGNINDTDYQKELDKLQYLKTGLNMVAAGLSAPTDSAAGIAAATVSPAIAYEIGQQFKNLAKENADGKLSTKQEAAHILAHAVLGAAVAAAGGNDAMMAAVAAGGAEAAAPVVSKWLYGEADGSQLTAEQKETVAAIAGLAGAAVGATAGNAADAAQGSQAAQNAVENNLFVNPQNEAIKTSGCKTAEECQALRQAYDKGTVASAKYIGAPTVDTLLSELFPIYDLGSSYYQAETPADKMLAFIAILPFDKLSSSAKGAYMKAKDLLKNGKSSEAYGYFVQISHDLASNNVSLAVAGNGVKVKVPKGEIPSQAMASTSGQYRGGAHADTKKPINDRLDSHHCPAQSCYKGAPISSENGPAIQMDPGDHKRTASYGNTKQAREYRRKQQELLQQGKLQEAIDMDVRDIKSKFGNKYDKALKEMLDYSKTLNPKSFKTTK